MMEELSVEKIQLSSSSALPPSSPSHSLHVVHYIYQTPDKELHTSGTCEHDEMHAEHKK